MSLKILALIPMESIRTQEGLNNISLETLNAAKFISESLKAELVVGLWGNDVQQCIKQVGHSLCKKIIYCEHPLLQYGTYSKDVYVAQKIYEHVGAEIVIAPATSRINRIIGAVAFRVKGTADTHVCGIEVSDNSLKIKRWFYKQRILVQQERTQRPWFISLDSQVFDPLEVKNVASHQCEVEKLNLELEEQMFKTKFLDIISPSQDKQTIKPDAKLLFVAGAGWTKRQSDPSNTIEKASDLILTFLEKTGASLGGSKSIVDISSEGHSVLPFMTHLNQVGQTGSSPRHPKGLATCCHGEEPHVVGWRFIKERRAINLDPNCGWARGKADVVYVSDAFKVIEKVNEILSKK